MFYNLNPHSLSAKIIYHCHWPPGFCNKPFSVFIKTVLKVGKSSGNLSHRSLSCIRYAQVLCQLSMTQDTRHVCQAGLLFAWFSWGLFKVVQIQTRPLVIWSHCPPVTEVGYEILDDPHPLLTYTIVKGCDRTEWGQIRVTVTPDVRVNFTPCVCVNVVY